ncbi:hypothetical protein EVAR_3257_1 [Eumeta japonica]|uniref:Uncharacterized protein n=1 Tax=Eumeta variegata TaxID=151549 RepID=A0A4C1SUT5_EUMVA|nr:hypothetical protein EVAR_3257_1 [Eumeta japonica]
MMYETRWKAKRNLRFALELLMWPCVKQVTQLDANRPPFCVQRFNAKKSHDGSNSKFRLQFSRAIKVSCVRRERGRGGLCRTKLAFGGSFNSGEAVSRVIDPDSVSAAYKIYGSRIARGHGGAAARPISGPECGNLSSIPRANMLPEV